MTTSLVAAPHPSEAITSRTPLLEACGIEADLGGSPVLRGVDLRVEPGEVVGLVGPNGAGKSTLLRVATGLVDPTRGHVRVAGRSLADLSRRELARQVAVVQQLPEAPHAMQVRELVTLGRHPHLPLLGRESARDLAIVEEAIRLAGCLGLADRALGTLSGGERRRAFIARALAQEASLLLLDEPTANLDAGAQSEILELVTKLTRSGTGVLLVVHDLTLAAAFCHRVVLLDRGRVVAEGPPHDVVTDDIVRRVYGPAVSVITHPRSGAPMIVPARLEG